jgi:hypothetical protein
VRNRLLVLAIAAFVPGIAAAADFGTLTVGGKTTPLVSAMAYAPTFGVHSDGKPDVVVILASQNLDSQILQWIDPSRGAKEAVSTDKGFVVTLEYVQQKIAHISVDGPGLGIEHQGCAKCSGSPARGGDSFKDHVIGEVDAFGGSSSGITFDTHFDVAKVQTQEFGEALPADGGAPGKAFAAYAKAYADGDYEALKKVATDADGIWKDETDAAKRAHEIITWPRGAPRDAVILKGWQNQNSALLIVEGTPVNWTSKKRFGVGLVKIGGQWTVREQLMDIRGKIFSD